MFVICTISYILLEDYWKKCMCTCVYVCVCIYMYIHRDGCINKPSYDNTYFRKKHSTYYGTLHKIM